MADGKVLEFSGVTKVFGDVSAVSELTARIEPGVVTAFLGPNGAGKTTSLRILLGDVRATSGSATIGGTPFSNISRPARTVGAVLESPTFRQRRTATRQLTSVAKANGIPLTRVREVIDLVGLADVADIKIAGFSLGMRQRLAVAQALLGDPGVLIFDEPVNGMDPEGIRWMRLLMRRLADEGRTVLMSSHLLSEVQQIADRILIISNGTLVFSGGIEELADVDPIVAVDSPDRAALTRVLREQGYEFEVLRSGVNVRDASARELGRVAAEAGIALSVLHQRGASLEDVFLDLVNGRSTRQTAALPRESGAVATEAEAAENPEASTDGSDTDAAGAAGDAGTGAAGAATAAGAAAVGAAVAAGGASSRRAARAAAGAGDDHRDEDSDAAGNADDADAVETPESDAAPMAGEVVGAEGAGDEGEHPEADGEIADAEDADGEHADAVIADAAHADGEQDADDEDATDESSDDEARDEDVDAQGEDAPTADDETPDATEPDDEQTPRTPEQADEGADTASVAPLTDGDVAHGDDQSDASADDQGDAATPDEDIEAAGADEIAGPEETAAIGADADAAVQDATRDADEIGPDASEPGEHETPVDEAPVDDAEDAGETERADEDATGDVDEDETPTHQLTIPSAVTGPTPAASEETDSSAQATPGSDETTDAPADDADQGDEPSAAPTSPWSRGASFADRVGAASAASGEEPADDRPTPRVPGASFGAAAVSSLPGAASLASLMRDEAEDPEDEGPDAAEPDASDAAVAGAEDDDSAEPEDEAASGPVTSANTALTSNDLAAIDAGDDQASASRTSPWSSGASFADRVSTASAAADGQDGDPESRHTAADLEDPAYVDLGETEPIGRLDLEQDEVETNAAESAHDEADGASVEAESPSTQPQADDEPDTTTEEMNFDSFVAAFEGDDSDDEPEDDQVSPERPEGR